MLEEISSIIKKIPLEKIEEFTNILHNSKSNRIWIIGNGGSASTASHFKSDLSSIDFDVVCPSENISRITALTNDFGWDEVYIKQLSHLKPNDVLIIISVHGGSESWSNNLVKALFYAKGRNAKILSLTGFDGGVVSKYSNSTIIVPAEKTYIIEGIHSILTHVIWKQLEDKTREN